MWDNSHCKESLCTWGYCLPCKSFVKLLLDLEGCSGSKILSEDPSSLWKPLHFNPVSPVSEQDDAWWKSLLLFHRDDFFPAPFPTARTSATTRASDCCLSLPAFSQSLPGANISLAKNSSPYWAWFWKTPNKKYSILSAPRNFRSQKFQGGFSYLFI